MKVLGIWISKNFEEMIKTNFEESISKLKNLLNIWAQRNLTLKGQNYNTESKSPAFNNIHKHFYLCT